MAKRKKYEEYRSFQEEWTEEFAFVERAGSAVCHANFASKYPAGDSRKKACQELLSRVQASQQQLRVWTRQGDYNSASFAGSLAIVRNGKPFTDGEYAKTFMLDVGNELFDDFTNKDKIIKRIQDMPLSATTVHDRTIMMANQVEETQVKDINAAPFFSLALDESTDVSHLSQFSVITRYAAGDTLREESLAVLPLKGSTRVVQGQDGWAVTYTPTEICALRGSTVDMRCNYTYPSSMNGLKTTVERTFWFVKMNGNGRVDLTTDPQYSGRVDVQCGDNDCTLRITDLRESDSAEYKFRFITNQPGGRYSGSPGVTLSVTDLQVQVRPSSYSTWAELTCHSSCRLPAHPSYVWYKNGEKIEKETSSSYSGYFGDADSYSCAVAGHEDSPSPPVCVRGQSCNKVTYADRRICAVKGSSVDISCTYNSYNRYIRSKLWFSPGRSLQWQSPSQLDFQRRVQVLDEGGRRSTLRISDLRESDSAEYRFTFTAGSFEWGRSLPATTLTVTDVQVQVSRISVSQSYTEAELKCHSSCSPAARLSYVWFRNGTKISGVETSSYKDGFYVGDVVSCALKGHEDYVSASVYGPKLPSVSVSPSAEIVEGSSVTLNCSSDANPAAEYIWYKENHKLMQGPKGIYPFKSIRLEDNGIYYCKSQNQYGLVNSTSVHINVQYGPKLPSVSVSPSAEIVEGSSVTLSCSSDANPAANYTWYKENEDSPKASGQNFTITDFRAEQSGNYYCEAQNLIGSHRNTLHLTVVASLMKVAAAGSITAILLVIIVLSVFLFIRKKRSSKQTTERPDHRTQVNMGSVCDNTSVALESQPAEERDDLWYASVRFHKNQEDALYSNITPVQRNRQKNEEEEEDSDCVEYSAVNFNNASAPQVLTCPEDAAQDPSALYSTITKKPA